MERLKDRGQYGDPAMIMGAMSWPPGVKSLDTVSFRLLLATMKHPNSVAEAWPELLISEAAAAIVLARNSLRVFIVLISPASDLREDLARATTPV